MTDPAQRAHEPRPWYSVLGPGLVTGAADDDPSGIGTYSQVGAQFGYALPWPLLFSLPLMACGCGTVGLLQAHGLLPLFNQLWMLFAAIGCWGIALMVCDRQYR